MTKVEQDLDKLLDFIDHLNDEEERHGNESIAQPVNATTITPDMLDALAARINQQLKEGKKDREQATDEKAHLRRGKERLRQQQKYQRTLEKFGDKNSMSMSDPEAPAMMMKDKVSIKPGYNVGISIQNGIVTGYEVSDNANDGNSFKAMVTESNTNLETKPQRVCADAGYGNAENYRYLEAEGIEYLCQISGVGQRFKRKAFVI